MKCAAILILLSLSAATAQEILYLITAPNIIRLDTSETLTVQLHRASKPFSIQLYFEKLDKKVSNEETVVLNADNGYQAVVNLKVDSNLYKLDHKHGTDFVYLAAKNTELFQNGKEQEIIMLSSRRGYIFIQTDKPIYTPGQTVNFRVFTLDQYLRPKTESIQINVLNSKDQMVKKDRLGSNHFYKSSIKIPDVAQAGNWKILASFSESSLSKTSVEFEVKEYVLPTFEVKIKTSKPYYLLKEQMLNFSVSARYTYGKPVQGLAYVRFALIDEHGNRTYLPGLEKQSKIQDGSTDIYLLTEELREAADNRSVVNIEGHHLYIAVTALETATGELEEADGVVKIVSMPYLIDLSKTKQYFTPEGIFSILASTTYPDGTAVPNPRMKATVDMPGVADGSMNLEGVGNDNGDAVLPFKVPKEAKQLRIKVFAEGEVGRAILSDAHMTAMAVSSPSQSYLSIEVAHVMLRQGQDMAITFRDITPPALDRPTHIYYLILSKSEVVRMRRVQRTELTTETLAFSNDLVPSFRIVAYYYIHDGVKWVMVTDSVWVDVQNVCRDQVEILPFEGDYRPTDSTSVKVRAEKGTTVALSAVDTAVYILNKRNKLTSQKVFEYMNSYDLACSVGGGKDHPLVLKDAGLTFISNTMVMDAKNRRKDYSCEGQKVRQKRSLDYQKQYSALVNQYKQPELKKCCVDGAKMHPMRLSCESRHAKTTEKSPECRQAFLECCKSAAAIRHKLQKTRRASSIARTGGIEEEDFFNDFITHLRSYFPETWMWVTREVDASGLLTHVINVPDSITTWEVQAIGMSKSSGFCIAEPKPLRVFQDFFVSMKLPYSVKRNEQLEVKAVVYNYREEPLEVTVKMLSVEGLCSSANERNKQVVNVPGNSAVAVYFVVVPLILGKVRIQINAHTSGGLSDGIEKALNVVGEGELVCHEREHNLDARDATSLDIEIPNPHASAPGAESDAFISVKGGVMGESVENCLNLEGVDKLIKLPTGCAEQTMLKMSPAIHAMRYLDSTNQWFTLKAERRDEAREMIETGYTRIVTFTKNDGSYGAFLHTPSSVWLTAFIAKELIRASFIINVEYESIVRSISYLVSKQQEDGSFTDPHPVYDRTMQGGVGGYEGDVSLTAFVLVTLQQSLAIYENVKNATTSPTHKAIHDSVNYLSGKVNSLQRPFAVAITAYALTLARPNSSGASRAQAKLQSTATCDDVSCHWQADESRRLTSENKASQVPTADAISVEATAYALLQTLLGQNRRQATRIARWLTEQRRYGGGFRSTQDTIVALEALSEYSIKNNDVEDLEMQVEVCLPRNTRKILINSKNALIEPYIPVPPGSKFQVKVAGRGCGSLSVIQTYRSLKRTDLYCDYYHLNVTLEGEVQYQKNDDYGADLEDYYNYEASDNTGEPTGVQAEEGEPQSTVEWFDLRSRRKRFAPLEQEKEQSLFYTVCAGTKSGNATGMAVVDISLLSGLELNIRDLADYTEGTEKYIDHFDQGPNKLYLYFNQLTESVDCIRFRAKQLIPVGLVQPAGAVIYDYYNPERRCSIFYSAPSKSSMVSKLCKDDVCACAEGQCPKRKVTFSNNMMGDTRSNYACFNPIVDYVYLVKVNELMEDGVFLYYTVSVTKVLQSGKDGLIMNGHVREMVYRKNCDDFQMKIESDYLVMGKDTTVADTRDDDGHFQYIINSDVWIEEIPEERRCQATKNRMACQLLHDFIENYELKKCGI